MKERRLFATLFIAVALASCKSVEPNSSLNDIDRAAVLAVTYEYRDAWLANDDERVMATLVRDAVLVPAGMAPIAGHEAIRNFWFAPATTPTTVIRIEQNVTDVMGGGDAAIVSGRGSVAFQTGTGAQTRTQYHWFANILTRQPDGRWLIRRRVWVDLPRA